MTDKPPFTSSLRFRAHAKKRLSRYKVLVGRRALQSLLKSNDLNFWMVRRSGTAVTSSINMDVIYLDEAYGNQFHTYYDGHRNQKILPWCYLRCEKDTSNHPMEAIPHVFILQ